MKLENIGFYTLNDNRAATANYRSQLSRCELILTSRCNFHCPYCRNIGGEDMDYIKAIDIIDCWAYDGLQNIRFSGGEPALYPEIFALCKKAKRSGIKRIAISTNGSASIETYQRLIDCGVNDFSISLDACCAEDCNKMAGGIRGIFEIITQNIQLLSTKTYVTVGIVLTKDNIESINNIIDFADSLGVSDIRIIPAAQNGNRLSGIQVDKKLLEKYPILKYRVENIQKGKSVRGLCKNDTKHCGLVLDDMAINHDKHYPCIIYMRESGQAIGQVGETMRLERKLWYETHNTYNDPICRANCLDVCIDYNNQFAMTNPNAIDINDTI